MYDLLKNVIFTILYTCTNININFGNLDSTVSDLFSEHFLESERFPPIHINSKEHILINYCWEKFVFIFISQQST